MGRIKLRRLLTGGLVLILFLSLLISAVGVSVLVRGYLWNRSHRESEAMAGRIQRFLESRDDLRRPRLMSRGMRRFNRGGGQLLLVKRGQIVMGAEEADRDWTEILPLASPGFHEVEFEGEQWQVLTRDVDSPLADRFVLIRPWSPSQRVVNVLVLYQVGASFVVMVLALFAVSYFASRLAQPLEELRKKTKAVGQRRVENLQSSKVVEIADLQASFIDMSHRVDEAMASQRQFVADASHELKTPLTAISGMLELLQQRTDMDYDDRVQAVNVARKEAERMESLITDLLLLSRAQAKRSGTTMRIPLAELVTDQVETLKVVFPEQEFRMEGDTDVAIQASAKAIARVTRNLLENAARYGGGEPVEVRLEKRDGEVVLAVKDRGPGIPEEKLERLFERFYRTDTGRARAEGGHGLGLAIVKALVEEAGGSITCVSKVGEGSEFRILFPSATAESRPA